MTLEKGINLVRRLRKRHDLPIIIFSYYNPILAMGPKRFVSEAALAGADGVLVVDLPNENSDEIMQYVESPGSFSFIRLIAPTTAPERCREVLRQADGFVYVVSRRGVTGVGGIDWNDLSEEMKELRRETTVPLCVGFGISTPEDVEAASKIADGVIIGSAFQKRIEENPTAAPESIVNFIRSIKND